jgi:hypothetical protein
LLLTSFIWTSPLLLVVTVPMVTVPMLYCITAVCNLHTRTIIVYTANSFCIILESM